MTERACTMETGITKDTDNDKNTSTPWRLRFIKSPIVSSPVCEQVDGGFESFVSGLHEKVQSLVDPISDENLKSADGKIETDSAKEQKEPPYGGIAVETSLCKVDKGNTSDLCSSICLQTPGSSGSAKLWKPLDAPYDSFIVLDETIELDESDEENSFKKCDENVTKNISGVLPFSETAKLVLSPDAAKSDNTENTNLILLDETVEQKNVGNYVKLRPTVSEKNVLQGTHHVVTVTSIGQEDKENKSVVAVNVGTENNSPYSAGLEKLYCESNTLLTNKQDKMFSNKQESGTSLEQHSKSCVSKIGPPGVDAVEIEEVESGACLERQLKTAVLKIGDSAEKEKVTSEDGYTAKIEQVKSDTLDFVSSDPEENADNNNPEWELLKKLETDEERYKAVRLRWRNLVIPNPNKNLTYRSRGYRAPIKKEESVTETKNNPVITSRKRTHSADPTELHVPKKRQRTFSCTEVFDRKMIDIHKNLNRERNAILQKHEKAVQNLVDKTKHQLRSHPPGSVIDERIRALHVENVVELRYKCDKQLAAVESQSTSQLRTLEKAMEEVRVFNSFYQGLEAGRDDALLLTDEQLIEVLEEDHLYECFAEIYSG